MKFISIFLYFISVSDGAYSTAQKRPGYLTADILRKKSGKTDTKIIPVLLDQIQEFVCPGDEEIVLYKIPSKVDYEQCNTDQGFVVLYCQIGETKPNIFTMPFVETTASGQLESREGKNHYFISSDCKIKRVIRVKHRTAERLPPTLKEASTTILTTNVKNSPSTLITETLSNSTENNQKLGEITNSEDSYALIYVTILSCLIICLLVISLVIGLLGPRKRLCRKREIIRGDRTATDYNHPTSRVSTSLFV